MAVNKTISLSDALYLRWIHYNERHPDKIFNQVIREGLEHMLREDERESANAPSLSSSSL